MSRNLLSPRQREAIALLSEGLAFKHIADRMGVTLSTAEKHIQGAQKKLGMHNVAGLVAWQYCQRIAQLEATIANLPAAASR